MFKISLPRSGGKGKNTSFLFMKKGRRRQQKKKKEREIKDNRQKLWLTQPLSSEVNAELSNTQNNKQN